MSTKPQTLKGFRDLLPDSMRIRNYVLNIFKTTFESFGFEPLETPALEYSSTLLGKYGQEADKLVYTFQDKGDRQIGLRYDLTVPVSKVLSIYQDKIPLPFKRYQIQPVWRADKPQKGRYREFYQTDIDIFGSDSPIADAEIISLIYVTLKRLNFTSFTIQVNSRQVLYQILNETGINSNQNSIIQSLDKLEKIQKQGVSKELLDKGLSSSLIEKLFSAIQQSKPDNFLKQVFDIAKSLGVPDSFINFCPTLARGLDYYTGPIFETYVTSPKIGSITGGGRYDNLVKTLGGPDIKATGTTLGFERIVDCINELNLLPDLNSSTTKVLVSVFDPESQQQSFKVANTLRQNSVPVFLYPDSDKLGKQFKYASDKKIPYVAVIGPDEIKANTITLKNMQTGQQKTVKIEDLLAQVA